ncbi:MAG TPA: NACHT domain-containing protein [Gammaproteobacteria bacterium]|nr:NACHT domain-containing protein [Gammaproteobacteria bacterium]
MTAGGNNGAADYLAAFALNCEPFADKLDSRFFYGGTALMQRLDLLTHLTQFGDAVIFVSGPSGSGKTTLLSRFVAQANSQWRLCLMEAGEFGNFPARLADALHSNDIADEAELLAHWAASTDNSQLLVIIIDNSEQLDEPAFQRLCKLLAQPAAERVRVIMFGLPDAQQRHRQAIEQQQLSCTTRQLDMPRLSEEETASYLMYRLAVAGYSGESPFSATEVAAMCKAADGRPAQINRLAHDALTERQARAGSKRMRTHGGARKGSGLFWALAAVGVLALAGWLGWQKQVSDSPAGDVANREPVPMEELPLALPEPRPLTTPAAETPPERIEPVPPVTPPLVAGPPEEQPAVTPEMPTSLAPVAAEPSVADTQPAQQETPATTAAPDASPEPAETLPATADSAVSEPPAPASAPAPAPEQPVPLATVSNEPGPAADTTAPAPEPATDALPHRSAWLLDQPETAYTLQLLGSRHVESIADYIRQHRLDPQQAAFYRGLYKGSEWYVLLYGSYPSRQAALDARAGLPARVRKAKPWPRSMKSVHAAIREAQ